MKEFGIMHQLSPFFGHCVCKLNTNECSIFWFIVGCVVVVVVIVVIVFVAVAFVTVL